MACIFTDGAENDLEDIADYISLDNPARAISFIQEIRERSYRIAYAPQGYPLAPEFGENIRKVPFRSYLILYTTHGEDIIITHIRHNAKNLPDQR